MRKRLLIMAAMTSMMLVACGGENKPDISNMETHSAAETTTAAETEARTEPETTSIESPVPTANREFNPYFEKDTPAEMAEAMEYDLMNVFLLQMNSVTMNEDWDEQNISSKRIDGGNQVKLKYTEDFFQKPEPQFKVGTDGYILARFYDDGTCDTIGYRKLLFALLEGNPINEQGREFVKECRNSYRDAISQLVKASNGVLTKEFLENHTSTLASSDNYFVFYDMKDANQGYDKEYYVICKSPYSYEANEYGKEFSTDLDELIAKTQELYEN